MTLTPKQFPPKRKTKEYYRDALNTISLIGMDYDGYNSKSAKQMKGLVDDLVSFAEKAWRGEKLWFK